MSAPTETHYDLRRKVIFSDADEGAQLIADSEARAIATQLEVVVILTRRWLNVEKERDQLRARAEKAEAEIKERAAMMRDVMRERNKAEAELTAERARLDWLETPSGMDWQWEPERLTVSRASIDAAMKEDAK
jgi:hypothetical protein